MRPTILFCGFLFFAATLFAKGADTPADGLANTTILIIRHAEKPESGWDLAPAGQERARAYTNYFKNLSLDNQPVKISYIFATADSKGSHRPRLTVEPTAQALGLPVDSRFADKDVQGLAKDLRANPHGPVILIAWHHGQIPSLLQALSADPEKVIPNGKWPDDVFGWLIELRYDAHGKLIETHRINENLMPDDAAKGT